MWGEIFHYDGKNLIWKHRPEHLFKSKAAWVSTNSRFEGKVAGRRNCAKGSVIYIQVRYLGRIYYAHRIIWEMFFGEIPKGMFLDHIDGNGTNNEISNLRLVDSIGNARNHPIRSTNTSGFNGVYPLKKNGVPTGKWAVNIYDKGSQIYLGCFDTKEEAGRIRREANNKIGYHKNHGRKKCYS